MKTHRNEENNKDIRQEIRKRRLYYYEVAEALGIREETFSRMMRAELAPEKKKQVLEAIRNIEA